MTAPRFSVLLPTHNRPDVLPFAIRSLLAQSEPDFELLIVGDGCTDHTSEVVRGFDDPRVRWFNFPKAPGFGYANRNRALREARGEWIAYATHDDLCLYDHLALLLGTALEHGAEFVYSRPLWVAPDGAASPGTFNLNHPGVLRAFLGGGENAIPSGCVMHRRDSFARYGYWDERLLACADSDLWVRIIAGGGGANFAYLATPTLLHFRANWRTERNAGPAELKVWSQLHGLKDFMPPALKFAPRPGLTLQESAWNALSADPRRSARDLRTAVDRVLDARLDLNLNVVLSLARKVAETDRLISGPSPTVSIATIDVNAAGDFDRG